jgi:hypothetical protein
VVAARRLAAGIGYLLPSGRRLAARGRAIRVTALFRNDVVRRLAAHFSDPVQATDVVAFDADEGERLRVGVTFGLVTLPRIDRRKGRVEVPGLRIVTCPGSVVMSACSAWP